MLSCLFLGKIGLRAKAVADHVREDKHKDGDVDARWEDDLKAVPLGCGKQS
jgi:hypothetical protein